MMRSILSAALLPAAAFVLMSAAPRAEEPATCHGATGGVAAAVTVHVTGVTADNAADLKKRLLAVRSRADGCSGTASADCGTECLTGGETKCVAMASAVKAAEVDVAAGEVKLQLAAGERLRLSTLDKALDGSGVAVDRRHVALHGGDTLVVSGMSCGGCEGAVAGALGAKLGSIDVAFESSDASPVKITAAKAGVTLGDAIESLAETHFAVRDVEWQAAAECCSQGATPASVKTSGCCAEESVPVKVSAPAGGCCAEESVPVKVTAPAGGCCAEELVPVKVTAPAGGCCSEKKSG